MKKEVTVGNSTGAMFINLVFLLLVFLFINLVFLVLVSRYLVIVVKNVSRTHVQDTRCIVS